MFNERVEILANTKVNASYWKLTFRSKKIAQKCRPGHFVNLQVENSYDPFLRRPFSVYRVKSDRVELLYEVVGKGTQIMSRFQPGDTTEVLAPLGRLYATPKKGTKFILVGGGVGIVPLVYWDEVYGADYLIMGHRHGAQVLPPEELGNKKSKKFISTNDGSAGRKGFVTDILKGILEKEKGKPCYILTCGPTVMMDAVRTLAAQYGVPGELSVEETMACGVGACLGCVVETKSGYKTSCLEGPVFPFSDFKHLNTPPVHLAPACTQ